MAQQGELQFPKPTQTVQLDPARAEPSLWVRRLVIWEEPGKIIREIPLRRGLNIIWSPDPGASAAILGESAGSGHGAGKTLFCRLLRYCLGEAQFANTALRRSIAETLPTGLVGAEVVINGMPWAAIRPIGTTRKHWAVENKTLEAVLESDGPSTGMDPLFAAIATNGVSADLTGALPGSSENREWLYALGWMSRDQECRYDHILDWRHPDADTGSPLRDLSREEVLLVVRLYLNLISNKEIGVQRKRAKLPGETALEGEIAYNHRRIEQLGAELVEALDIALTVPLNDPLGAGALSNAAKESLTNIQKEGVPKGAVEQLTPLSKQRDVLTGRIAVAGEKIGKLDSLIKLQNAQLATVLGEKVNLDGEAIKAKLGDYCPICKVPIDRALAEGCGLSHMLQDLEKIEDEKSRKEAVILKCDSLLEDYRQQKGKKEALLTQMTRDHKTLTAQIAEIEKQDQAAKDVYTRRLVEAENLVRRCNRLIGLLDAKTKAHSDLESRNQNYKKLKDQLDKLREQHSDTMTRLSELFDYVSKGFLGKETKGTLKLTGKELQANVQVGGLAMVSLKAIIFDVTALLMSLEGKSELPAFLMHDSPREADLGLSHYHRPFRLLRELEGKGKEAPFQYIITTTTEPPKEMQNGICMALKLDGANAENKLLRRDFVGGHDAS